MGWLFNTDSGQSKADYVKEVVARNFQGSCKVERQALVGNHLWLIVNFEGRKEIVLLLLAKQRGSGWGYKDMTESMGPCYYTCPLAFLDACPVPDSEYAKGWREKVRAYHAGKATKRKALAGLKVGDRVQLVKGCSWAGEPLTEVELTSIKPLRGMSRGRTFTLRPSLVAGKL